MSHNPSYNPDARPSVHLKIKIAVTVRRGISKRSREKIGDCEQSKAMAAFFTEKKKRNIKREPMVTIGHE